MSHPPTGKNLHPRWRVCAFPIALRLSQRRRLPLKPATMPMLRCRKNSYPTGHRCLRRHRIAPCSGQDRQARSGQTMTFRMRRQASTPCRPTWRRKSSPCGKHWPIRAAIWPPPKRPCWTHKPPKGLQMYRRSPSAACWPNYCCGSMMGSLLTICSMAVSWMRYCQNRNWRRSPYMPHAACRPKPVFWHKPKPCHSS